MSQLGRIGGQVLTDNLLRAGIDIAFETDLLYLKVSPVRSGVSLNEDSDPNFGKPLSTSLPAAGIGINTDVPLYNLDVNQNISSTDVTVQTQLSIDNIIINAPNTFTTSVGGINIFIAGSDIFHDRLITANLEINDNYIASFSNANITLDPSGSGIVQIIADTNIVGNLVVGTSLSPKNINISGNLSKQGNLILGDQTLDTITVNTDFSQSIIPGDNSLWSLGENTGDSSPRRWNQVYGSDWTGITTGAWPGSGLTTPSVFVSDQLHLDGTLNKLSSLQSNDDILLTSDTGVTFINLVQIGQDPFGLTQTLSNPNVYSTTDADRFGYSIDVSDSRLIVGALGEDDAGGSFSGKAYVYDLDTNFLLYTLTNPNAFGTSNFDAFGYAVAISSSYLIVGAPGEMKIDENDYESYGWTGKAYIFNATTGALLYTLDNPSPGRSGGVTEGQGFGSAVAMTNTRAIVGAFIGGSDAGGRAYIYNTATGALLYTLINPNSFGAASSDYFGFSVDISDSYAIVGAFGEDTSSTNIESGRAYIYSTTTGALLHNLNNPNPFGTSRADRFGYKVAISDSYAAVGAPGEGSGLVVNWPTSGLVYIYNPATGALLRTISNPNPVGTQFADRFGSSVAISGSRLIVGAAVNDDVQNGQYGPFFRGAEDTAPLGGVGDQSGKAYIFDIATGALLHTLDNPNAFGTVNNDYFGFSVAISNSYVVVGTQNEDDAGGTQSGKVYIFSDPPFDQSVIINRLSTPLSIVNTGIGYTLIAGNNAMVVPSGINAERRLSPEVGETRWNTEEGYLECYDGTVWAVSTGGGVDVTTNIMEDLGHAYTLMLG
jgi:hypothetical protein